MTTTYRPKLLFLSALPRSRERDRIKPPRCGGAKLGPMQETRRHESAWLAVRLARTQIPFIRQNRAPLLVVNGERTLRHRVRKVIQRRIDARCDEKKADHEEGESF